jgi:tetratricopeptide (TPR) repeat protein
MALNRRQRRAEARAASTRPAGASIHLNSLLETGLRHHQAGRLTEATEVYRQALTLDPGQADALHLSGLAAHQLGQNAIAAKTIGQAIAAAPKIALYRCSLGNALKALGRMDEASVAYTDAIRLQPDFAEAHYNLGTALMALGRIDDAVDAFRAATRLKPDFTAAHLSLGAALREMGRLDAALAAYTRAIRVTPENAEAHTDRGNLLKAVGRLEEALAAHAAAIRVRPDFAEAHYNLGNTLKALGRLDEAIAAYRAAIRGKPDFAEAHVNLGMELLLAGDFAHGWAAYAWRLRGALSPRTFSRPAWRGESLAGRRILLHAEQGLGDTIQFCRYVPLVAARGGLVTLEAPRPLLRLLSGLSGVTRLIAEGESIPAFDVHCSLMSLPLAFGTEEDTIPAQVPYLAAKPDRIAYWRDRLGPKTRPRVGLVWSGGFRPDQPALFAVNARRNIPLPLIGQLNRPDIDFVSLQKGEPAEGELRALQDTLWPGGNFTNAGPDIGDFDDTAGLIETLDLVISVDTSTAHLAAAMGKPVWLLNRFDSCWRWLRHREDSPWYPTVRLFRQTEPGDWHGVARRVAAALTERF